MGKLKMQDMDYCNINNFLINRDRVSPSSVEFFAYQSVFILLGILVCAKHKFFMGAIVIPISIVILRSILYYSKNYKNNARYTYIYHGIYTIVCSVSCNMLACVCLKGIYMSSVLWFLVLLLGCIIVAFMTFICVKKKIASNDYRYNFSVASTTAVIGGIGYFMARNLLEVMELKVVIGLAIACLGIIYVTGIASLMKVYCFDLIQKEKRACEVPKDRGIFVVNSDDKRCLKAKEWLDSNNIEYSILDISMKKVKYQEIKNWHQVSKRSLNEFFNIESPMYKRAKLKERLPNMGNREQYEMLSSTNQLIKCPLFICSEFVLIGFKLNEWEEKFKKK